MKVVGAFVCHGAGSWALLSGHPSHRGMVGGMKVAAPELFEGKEALYSAVVFVSAHYHGVDGAFAVTSSDRPGGVSKRGPPGDPVLAKRIATLLNDAEIACVLDARSKLDDVVVGPMTVMFPALVEGNVPETIPVLSLSISSSLDPRIHARAGRALAPLTSGPDKPVLFVGSGHTWHNFALTDAATAAQPEVVAMVADYQEAVERAVVDATGTDASRNLEDWRQFPNGPWVHATGDGDHLMPLLVVAGAAGDAATGTKIPIRAFNLDTTDFVFQRAPL